MDPEFFKVSKNERSHQVRVLALHGSNGYTWEGEAEPIPVSLVLLCLSALSPSVTHPSVQSSAMASTPPDVGGPGGDRRSCWGCSCSSLNRTRAIRYCWLLRRAWCLEDPAKAGPRRALEGPVQLPLGFYEGQDSRDWPSQPWEPGSANSIANHLDEKYLIASNLYCVCRNDPGVGESD